MRVLVTGHHCYLGSDLMPGVARERRIRIFAPAPPLTAAGPEAIATLMAPPFLPVTFERWPMPVEVVAYAGPALAGVLRRWCGQTVARPIEGEWLSIPG